MKKLAWLTDPHFDKCDISKFETIAKKFEESSSGGLVVTGDISENGTTMLYLSFLQNLIRKPIWFVFGNHDWYNVSRKQNEEFIKKYSSENLIKLDSVDYIKLNKSTCLVGGENWWDASFKSSFGLLDNIFMSEDYEKIEFIKPLKTDENIFSKVKTLSKESSELLITKLAKALLVFDKVYLAVHVPPFKEGCLYSGIVMPENWLNHFCDVELGLKLKVLMKAFPEKELVILSGHTHSKSEIKIKQNIKQYVGKVKVADPKINEVFKLI
jgi:predicted phosphodiesterase